MPEKQKWEADHGLANESAHFWVDVAKDRKLVSFNLAVAYLELSAQVEALKLDAARYRWLNAKDNFLIYIDKKPLRLKCGEPLDRYIDAEIANQAEAK